jgi:hypothetical protein
MWRFAIKKGITRLVLLGSTIGMTSWWSDSSGQLFVWATINGAMIAAGLLTWLVLCHFVWDACLYRDEMEFTSAFEGARTHWMAERDRGRQ